MKEYKKKLIFVVTNYQVSIWPLCMLTEMIMYYFYKLAGENHAGEVIGEWSNRINRWAVNKKIYDVKIAEIIFKKIKKDPQWAWKTAKKYCRHADSF